VFFFAPVFFCTFDQAMPKPLPKALALRGGMDLGPMNNELAGQLGRTAAAVTVGGAVLNKYAGLGDTTLTKAFSGELFTTNAVIALVSGGLSVVTHAVSPGFDTTKLVAGLWIVNMAKTLMDKGANADTVMANKEAMAIAVVLGVMAWA
jgi:hypothetical protein